MFYNRQPERNVGFIPYIKRIRQMLDNERLAISPQLTLKLNGGREMCERCIKTKEEQVEWDRLHKSKGLVKEDKSKTLLNFNVGKCPCGVGDLWVVCYSKDDVEGYSGTCDHCGYVDNR